MIAALMLVAMLGACGGSSEQPSVAAGPPGTLDASFGAGGIVTTVVGESAWANAMVLQPDGRIVVAGSIGEGGGKTFFLARYNADGTLDTGFGVGGTVSTGIDPVAGGEARAVLLQPDGRIVAIGGSGGACALARYRADGTLDAGFGVGGIVQSRSVRDDVACGAAVLQPDGKVAVAVVHGPVRSSDRKGSMMRFNSDGSRDVSFGSGGEAEFDCAPGASIACEPAGMAIRPDGRLLASGTRWISQPFGGAWTLLLAQFAPDGTPDRAFGTNGFDELAPLNFCSAGAVVVQPDGKAVIAVKDDGGICFELFRATADGILDNGFGISGIALSAAPPGTPLNGPALVLQANGKLVVAASSWAVATVPPRPPISPALLRYDAGGSVDPSFGTDGMTTTHIETSATASAVAILPDGRIVVAGSVTTPSGEQAIFVARYFGDPVPPGAQ